MSRETLGSMDAELDKVVNGDSDIKTAMVVFALTLKQTRDDVKDVKELLGKEYAPKSALDSIDGRVRMLERIVYSTISVICLAFVGGLITLVIRK